MIYFNQSQKRILLAGKFKIQIWSNFRPRQRLFVAVYQAKIFRIHVSMVCRLFSSHAGQIWRGVTGPIGYHHSNPFFPNFFPTHNELKRGETMHCLPQRLKSMFFEIFFEWRVSERGPRPGVKKKFLKMLILVFEVIVQPPKHTFEIGIFPRFSN